MQTEFMKRAAKKYKKLTGCKHHEALDHIAQEHGFTNWIGYLEAKYEVPKPCNRLQEEDPVLYANLIREGLLS